MADLIADGTITPWAVAAPFVVPMRPRRRASAGQRPPPLHPDFLETGVTRTPVSLKSASKRP
jgi:hypothetical protein